MSVNVAFCCWKMTKQTFRSMEFKPQVGGWKRLDLLRCDFLLMLGVNVGHKAAFRWANQDRCVPKDKMSKQFLSASLLCTLFNQWQIKSKLAQSAEFVWLTNILITVWENSDLQQSPQCQLTVTPLSTPWPETRAWLDCFLDTSLWILHIKVLF